MGVGEKSLGREDPAGGEAPKKKDTCNLLANWETQEKTDVHQGSLI